MIRKIIRIDEEKCNGCGLCASACHEGAIEMINGKAKLVREHFCDGLGDCLPTCPTGAISFEEREAPAYDEAAVKESQRTKAEEQTMEKNTSAIKKTAGPHGAGQGCPGSQFMDFSKMRDQGTRITGQPVHTGHTGPGPQSQPASTVPAGQIQPSSRLNQWPCQIKLLPVEAPFYQGARLLIAADCSAYAYANMHEEFMKGRITVIGCPKLDSIDYSEKLTAIIAGNDIKSVTIVRMEVPCCGGLQRAAETALKNSGKFIPWQVVTISRDGRILDRS